MTQGSGCQSTVNFLHVSLPAVLIITVSFLPEKNYCMSFHGECIFILRQSMGCILDQQTRRRLKQFSVSITKKSFYNHEFCLHEVSLGRNGGCL